MTKLSTRERERIEYVAYMAANGRKVRLYEADSISGGSWTLRYEILPPLIAGLPTNDRRQAGKVFTVPKYTQYWDIVDPEARELFERKCQLARGLFEGLKGNS